MRVRVFQRRFCVCGRPILRNADDTLLHICSAAALAPHGAARHVLWSIATFAACCGRFASDASRVAACAEYLASCSSVARGDGGAGGDAETATDRRMHVLEVLVFIDGAAEANLGDSRTLRAIGDAVR